MASVGFSSFEWCGGAKTPTRMCLSVIAGSQCRKGASHIEWRGAGIFLDVLEELAEILVHVEEGALAPSAKAQREQDRLIFAVELVDIGDLFRDGRIDR